MKGHKRAEKPWLLISPCCCMVLDVTPVNLQDSGNRTRPVRPLTQNRCALLHLPPRSSEQAAHRVHTDKTNTAGCSKRHKTRETDSFANNDVPCGKDHSILLHCCMLQVNCRHCESSTSLEGPKKRGTLGGRTSTHPCERLCLHVYFPTKVLMSCDGGHWSPDLWTLFSSNCLQQFDI